MPLPLSGKPLRSKPNGRYQGIFKIIKTEQAAAADGGRDAGSS
jgi:hypothetical protein